MPTTSYTTRQVCDAAGVSYRRVDYWIRNGLIRPALGGHEQGSGSLRRWAPRQVATVAVLGLVAGHNRGREVTFMAPLVDFLEDLPLDRWPSTQVLLDDEGDVWFPGDDGPPVGTFVDLSSVLSTLL